MNCGLLLWYKQVFCKVHVGKVKWSYIWVREFMILLQYEVLIISYIINFTSLKSFIAYYNFIDETILTHPDWIWTPTGLSIWWSLHFRLTFLTAACINSYFLTFILSFSSSRTKETEIRVQSPKPNIVNMTPKTTKRARHTNERTYGQIYN